MKRQVSACQTSRSIYPSILNSFPVIRTLSAKKSPFLRTAAHIFAGDAPALITQRIAWMERQFDACQTPCSMYLSIFNSFRVIRCLSQCVSTKIAIFITFLFPMGTPLGQSHYMLYRWKGNSMLTNCLAECTHLTITVSEIERYIGRKSSFFHTPLHSMPPLGGFTSEHRHPVWFGKLK